jgi:hypothetical protein
VTLDEAIFLTDEMKPNQIDRARKIEWLSRLDKLIYREIILRHIQPEAQRPECPHYTPDTPPDTELLAKAPHDEIYRFYLETHIDLANQEYGKYNNSAALFSAAWGRMARAYHRENESAEGSPRLKF